jgi:hypothetical protein
MTPAQALQYPTTVLTEAQRTEYVEKGYLLLTVYSSADSLPYTSPSIASPHMGDIVRGRPTRFASFGTRPCEASPDWRGQRRFPPVSLDIPDFHWMPAFDAIGWKYPDQKVARMRARQKPMTASTNRL